MSLEIREERLWRQYETAWLVSQGCQDAEVRAAYLRKHLKAAWELRLMYIRRAQAA